MHMLNRIIFLLAVCLCLSSKANGNDTTRYTCPFIGYNKIIYNYGNCIDKMKKPEGAYELDEILKWKLAIDSFILLLEVHSDCRGDSSYNLLYTQRKADSLVAYMKRKCHDSIAVIGRGMGECQLVNHCTCEGEVKVICNETQHQENRRIVFKIIGRREF